MATEEDICANNHGGNPQSVIAHKRVSRSGRAAQDRVKLLEQIKKYGTFGRTADELVVELDMVSQTVWPRCSELKKLKLVFKSGTRKTTRGNPSAVLVAAEFMHSVIIDEVG